MPRICNWTGMWGLVLISVAIAGCGSSGPYGLKKVQGKVVYEDGSVIPASRIEVKFLSMEAPLDATTHPKPGIAEVKTDDGTFTDVSTYEYGDGAIKGKHKVVIKSMDANNMFTPAIPMTYHSVETTPLEVDTKDAPFEFKIPKP